MQISNREFLGAIFGVDAPNAHVTGFSYDPYHVPLGENVWGGSYYKDSRLHSGDNQYFTISTFTPNEKGRACRRKANYLKTYCVVLDDVKEKLDAEVAKRLPAPSYILETSAGSEQWGYILTAPETVASRIDNLNDGLIASDLAPQGKDPGQRGVTRYVRLPEGSNSKASKCVDGKPYKCQMLHWAPFNTVTLQSLAEPFGIDLDAPRREARVDGAALVEGHPLLDMVDIKSTLSDGRYDITCPWVHEHTGGDDSGTAVFTNSDDSIGFKCHHGACDTRTGRHLIDHLETLSPGFKAKLAEFQFFKAMGAPALTAPHATESDAPTQNPVIDFLDPLYQTVQRYFFVRGVEITRDALAEIYDMPGVLTCLGSILSRDATNVGFLNNEGRLVWSVAPQLAGKGSGGQLCRTYGADYDLVKGAAIRKMFEGNAAISDEDRQKLVSDVRDVLLKDILLYAKTKKQCSCIDIRTDMFTDTPSLTVDVEGRATNVRPFRMQRTPPHPRAVDVGRDFLDHFPEFHDFLDMLCAARFAPDRRQAYLWLHCPSSWGKSLLLSTLSGLDLVCEIPVKVIEKCFEGAPVGVNPDRLATAWVIAVDEARVVKAEVKQLSNTISLSPKNRMSIESPVYMKLFMSAEGIDSLAGETGVESQFAERFAYIKGQQNARVEDRELFRGIGPLAYQEALQSYVKTHILDYVDAMRALGREVASARSASLLTRLHVTHAIVNSHVRLQDTVEDLSSEFEEMLQEFGKCGAKGVHFADPCVSSLPPDLLRLLSVSFCHVHTPVLGPRYLIKRPGMVAKAWISSRTEGERAKVVHKSRDLCDRLGGSQVYRVSFDGGVTYESGRGLLVGPDVSFM